MVLRHRPRKLPCWREIEASLVSCTFRRHTCQCEQRTFVESQMHSCTPEALCSGICLLGSILSVIVSIASIAAAVCTSRGARKLWRIDESSALLLCQFTLPPICESSQGGGKK